MTDLPVPFFTWFSKPEIQLAKNTLQRDPTLLEWALFAGMWNEHVSYKSSRHLLPLLSTPHERMLQGPGENAGVVRFSEDIAIALRIESHNHPTCIDPYQGAATGLGGILRDIVATGAHPIAFLESIWLADPAESQWLLDGIQQGTTNYARAISIPSVGKEIHHTSSQRALFNAGCVGLLAPDKIFHARAKNIGDSVIYLGAPTGPDGIEGAIMASNPLGCDHEPLSSFVQTADPLAGRRLLDTCQKLIQQRQIDGIQDMGAAGLTCSSVELAWQSGMGMELHLDAVPLRIPMEPWQILLSETQERMLVTTRPSCEETVLKIAKQEGISAAVIGHTTDTNRLRIYNHNQIQADVCVSLLARGAPTPISTDAATTPRPPSIEFCPPQRSVVALLPVTDSPPNGLALLIHGATCQEKPQDEAYHLLAETLLLLACTGASALGLSNAINAASPKEAMSDIADACTGLANAARELDCPITGGNISLYNEGKNGGIDLTIVLLVAGKLADINRALQSTFCNEEDQVAVLQGPIPSLLSLLPKLAEDALIQTARPVQQGIQDAIAQCEGQGNLTCVYHPEGLTSLRDRAPLPLGHRQVIIAGPKKNWPLLQEACQEVSLVLYGRAICAVQ